MSGAMSLTPFPDAAPPAQRFGGPAVRP
jgi:hypothetical protein